MVKRDRLLSGDPTITQHLLKGQPRDWPLSFHNSVGMILCYQAGKHPGLRTGIGGAATALSMVTKEDSSP